MVVALQIALVNTSRFSKLNGVPGSVKEFDFQGVLQLRNVLTERGLRNIQLLRRSGYAFFSGDG